MSNSLSKDKLKLAFFITLISISFLVFINLPRIMIPFGIAYILALMLRPIQKSLYSVSLRKKVLGVVMILGVGFVLSYPVVKGIKTITEESHKIEYYLPKLEKYLRTKYIDVKKEIYNRFNYEVTINPVDKLVEIGQENTKSLFILLPKILASALEWSLIIPLFLFFIMRDERRVRFEFLKLVPNSIVERAYFLYYEFNTKFGDYIFAKFIEATVLGSIITAGLLIIDFPFAFLLGLVAAITNILPYIGPFLGFVPALVVGLVDQNPNTTLGAMALLYLIANIVDLALVFPILVSKIVNLHPIVVVVSVILGSQFAGVAGMIVSIPMAAFLKLLFEQVYAELYANH